MDIWVASRRWGTWTVASIDTPVHVSWGTCAHWGWRSRFCDFTPHRDFGPSLTIKGKTNEDPGVWGAEAVDLAVMDWFLLVINSYFKGLETQQFS